MEKHCLREWEQTSANHISDNGLLFKIYRELLQLKSKKKKQTQITQFKNGQKTQIDTSPPCKWPKGI